MKNLKDIIESQNFLVNKKLKNRQQQYEYHPQTRHELKDTIINLLDKKITDLNCIDVSNITDMSWMFSVVDAYITVENIDISDWDVSKVTNMYSMFDKCHKFNCDLSKWNVSNVKNTKNMFYKCYTFDSDLSNWNISNITDMTDMFTGCDTLIKNNKIPKWYKK